jgi:hypothetical protein
MSSDKPLRVVIDYDGKQYDSYEAMFQDQFLINAYSAAQKTFSMYKEKLNKAGAYIYMDANSGRPESFEIRGISPDMWQNILNSRRGDD